MTIRETESKYIEDLKKLGDPASQCEYLILLGISCRGDGEIRQDRYRIPGCKTAIWFQADYSSRKAVIRWDSESLLVRGVLAIFSQIYSGKTLPSIKDNAPLFLDAISDEVIYPEIKDNGIQTCYRRLTVLTV